MKREIVVKKAYSDIYAVLVKNKKKKVSEILDDLLEIMKPKTDRILGETFIRNSENAIVAIRCWYFKRWMPLVGTKKVLFGSKKSSTTGYNTMCKIGCSHWYRQQREKKKALMNLPIDIKNKKVKIDEIEKVQEEIEAKASVIEKTTLGFETKEEVIKYLASSMT
jgi:hypothetical protein